MAHFWNGRLILQAPSGGTELARLACRESRRALNGLIGPWAQVVEVRQGLGLKEASASLESREDLFSLTLTELRVPRSLTDGSTRCRRATAVDQLLMSAWRLEFNVETISPDRRPEVVAACVESVRKATEAGGLFILEAAGVPVATAAFNAQLPDCVQIGGVWTPPGQRRQGFGRAVVAGALLAARADGVTRSVLFTGEDNYPARHAYEAIGYARIGDYAIIAFNGLHWIR